MQGDGLDGGGHKGLTAHGGVTAGVGCIAPGHLSGNIAGLLEDSGLTLGSSDVDEDDAQQHTADDADGGSGNRYALSGSPVIQAQALKDLAHSAGSAVTAAEALAQLIAEGAVEIIVSVLLKNRLVPKPMADCMKLSAANRGESLEHIGSGLLPALGLWGTVHEHSRGTAAKMGTIRVPGSGDQSLM